MTYDAFDEYQDLTDETAQYPELGHMIVYPALGLSGEAGEVAEKVKKLMRDRAGVLDEDQRLALAKELGDVLWYVAQTARQAGLSLGDVAKMNVEKLRSRKERGQISGEGDDR